MELPGLLEGHKKNDFHTDCRTYLPQHFLNFRAEPQGHNSFRPTFRFVLTVSFGSGLGTSGLSVTCPAAIASIKAC